MSQSKQSRKVDLLLIDAMSLVFQSFYAIRGLKNAQGMPTGAIYGFVRQLRNIIETYEPAHVIAVFDSKGPSFRKEIYEDYKSNREEPPEEFHQQLPYVFKALDAMGVPRCEKSGYEADDLIGAFSMKAKDRDWHTLIASADKDLMQLVNEAVHIVRYRKDDMKVYDADAVSERMGVRPEQVVDYLALVGDSSDNIPGVPGIGPKTASKLLDQYGSLDGIYDHLEDITARKQKSNLSDNKQQAYLSRKLARIVTDMEIDMELEETGCEPQLDAPDLLELYRELGFTSLLKEQRQESGEEDDEEGDCNPFARNEIELDYQVVMTPEALAEVAEACKQTGAFAVDTETTGINTMRAGLVGISISTEPGKGWYIPIGHVGLEDAGRQLALQTIRDVLAPLFADAAVAKIAQNAKYDMRILERHGLPLAGVQFDTMLASYVLNPEGQHGLKAMALGHLGVEMTEITELIGKGRNAVTMADVEVERAAPYAIADADMTLRLKMLLERSLEKNPTLMRVFKDIEMPLVRVLDAMEAEGVTLDKTVLADFSKELHARLDAEAKKIYEIAGKSFSIKSPRQVADVLFTDIGLKPRGRTKTGQSTRSEVLEELAREHPLPAHILEFRKIDKLLSTYVDALPGMVNPETGRIHTSYNQFIAATGRLSSSAPNLQNIPKRGDLAKFVRRAFRPNSENHVFLAADYSQIELRVLAHMTGDKGLQEAFREDRDIHMQTACKVFGMPEEMVTDDMRSKAKVINFGIMYGMSAHRLARELDISRSQAQNFIDEYFAAYPGVASWKETLLEKARETGYVETLSGRRRKVTNLTVRNGNVRANAERMAVNTPIQGTSADMIKIAMVRIFDAL
ncbi:MAG: DNA polymerase I, partial [Candidatus Sumerlaeota bacterium]